jgi:pimeloyl-ACP methyl ester carboxylesterase
LAIVQGVNDTRDLVNDVIKPAYAPKRVYLIGASEGGLVTVLSAEQLPNVYNAGGAACGPIGSFQSQVNYLGDARVLFDYFFPGVLPPSPVNIPPTLMSQWESAYSKLVAQAIANNPQAAQQWLKVLQGTVTTDVPTMIQTGLGVLWYNIFATNDATATLGGQPYDNHNRIYLGSNNDWLLNFKVQRFTQSPVAKAAIAAQYETTGRLRMPLVTLHTTGDPIVPFWHETLYALKTLQAGTFLARSDIPVLRYGHCAFNGGEVIAAFALMVFRDIGSNLTSSIRSTLTGPALVDFERAGRLNGLIRE